MLSRVILSLAASLATAASIETQSNFYSIAVSDPASQVVTNSAAFDSGAGNTNNSNIHEVGNATDTYNCYYGSWGNFPNKSHWVGFDSMWNNSRRAMSDSCSNLGIGSCTEGAGASDDGDSEEQMEQIWDAIEQVSEGSLVDRRFMLAVILQESVGCVNVCASRNPDSSQLDNIGLMQSIGSVEFVGNEASTTSQGRSINQMVVDGTQGTGKVDGLVQCINQYGNIYEAARCYNSGSVDSSDLNSALGATASYVNDIANRMTGWIYTQRRFNQC